jgi:predicted DNA-binding transcriptional regulator AlpA
MKRDSAREGGGNLRDVLCELDGMAAQLQRDMQADDGSDQARLALAVIRRSTSERVEAVLRQIGPTIVEAEYRQPGITDDFYEIWFDRPDVRQGEMSWLRYLGNISQLLLRAVGPDAAAAAGRSASGAVKVKPGVSAAASQLESEPEDTNVHRAAAGADTYGLSQSQAVRPEELAKHVVEQLTARFSQAGLGFQSGSDQRVLTEREAARRIGMSVQTLRKWRAKGEGPRHVKMGKSIRYPVAEIDGFIRGQLDERRKAIVTSGPV